MPKYTNGSEVITLKTRGKPKKTIQHEGQEWTWVPETKTPKVAFNSKIVKEVKEGLPARVELHFEDGSTQVAGAGRPPKVNSEGSPLVKLVRWVAPSAPQAPVITVDVVEDPHTSLEYSDGTVVRHGRGKYPRHLNGNPLVKVTKYVLSESAPKPVQEDNQPTMQELGWEVGQKVKLKGSSKIGQVVVVRDYHVGVSYPGDKFVNTFNPKKLERV